MPDMTKGPWGVVADLWEAATNDEDAATLERLLLGAGWLVRCQCGQSMDFDEPSCEECKRAEE